ncbi:MAG: 5-formyltetrahydrofolate cyclo-ligase [Verrucomicrobiales bacterium]|nr:5-formyltetrahydrofolate cyclo-ligase [Verrucomicrobiales bacterium]
MSGDPAAEKARVRALVRKLLAAFSAEAQAAESARARALLLRQSVWESAATVLFYAPLPGELDIWPLLTTAMQAGKRVALPRFDPATGMYEPALVIDPARDIVLGKHGVREPSQACARVRGNEIDLVLVPGVAFDFRGFRLGRGKGYYDRLLPMLSGIKCGVAFEHQLVPRLPVEPHDYRLDCILTPARWIVVEPG